MSVTNIGGYQDEVIARIGRGELCQRSGNDAAPSLHVESQLRIWLGLMNKSSAGEASGKPILNWLWAAIGRRTTQGHERGHCESVAGFLWGVVNA